MNVLFTGRGTSGSWLIRGEQLGRAVGATVLPRAVDIGPFDLAVVVKRPPPDLLRRIHEADVPLVWDIVDAWPQPLGNEWEAAKCLQWLEEQVRWIRPAAIVAATQMQAFDCRAFKVPVLMLPHHARPGLQRNPIRPRMQVVGYEGGLQYIGRWGRVMSDICARRGLTWLPEPDSLAELDVVLAVRDQSGYAPRHWKSNVKMANAQGSGTPLICCREYGHMGPGSDAVLYADTPEEMEMALDLLTPYAARQERAQALFDSQPRLEDVAKTYREWLWTLRS